jgi:glutathione peroxidase
MSNNVFEFSCQTTGGQDKSLNDYKGKVLLVVNTASKCGFTPQFEGLEDLYETYQEQGLEILGFPCNQFGKQDPGSNDEIQEFCQLNYGVSFPMFGKIEVNGSGTDPLFKHLKKEAPGALGTQRIKWNFTKFLVNAKGKVIKRYAPTVKPKDIEKDIKKLLA